MLKSTEKIINAHLNDHIIRDVDLDFLLKVSPAKRYAIVNRLLKSGELIRICRGFYTLNKKYQKDLPDQNYFANRIAPFSFISTESALSFYHLIPERVTQTTSIDPFGRNRKFKTPYGIFTYNRVPIKIRYFYFGVNMIKSGAQFIYMATPLRALMDYVYKHKIENANVSFLEKSLRIEKEAIVKITKSEIKKLRMVYDSRYVKRFLKNLLQEL